MLAQVKTVGWVLRRSIHKSSAYRAINTTNQNGDELDAPVKMSAQLDEKELHNITQSIYRHVSLSLSTSVYSMPYI
jgi:methyl coenzyme M reductase gamma subunit